MKNVLLNVQLLFLSFISISAYSQDVYTTGNSGTWATAGWTCVNNGGGCGASDVPNSNDLKNNTIIVNHAISSGYPGFNADGGVHNLTINAVVSDMSSSSIKISNSGILNLTINAPSELTKIENSGSTLNLELNDVLEISSDLLISNNSSVTSIIGTSTLDVKGLLEVAGGTFNSSSSVLIESASLSIKNQSTVVNIAGDLIITNDLAIDAADVTFGAKVTGKNISALNSSAKVAFNGDAVFDGTISVNATNAEITGVGTLTFDDSNLTNNAVIDGDGNCGVTQAVVDAGSSPFFINLGTCSNIPLPIELSFFAVEKTNGGFQYNWETVTEIDNDYFVIEYSTSLKSFNELVSIPGAGTSFNLLEYEHSSNDLFVNSTDDVIYFRLKQVDFDGTFSYSHIVAISLENILFPDFELFPNPAINNVTIRFNNKDESQTRVVSVYSVSSSRLEKEFSIIETESQIDVSDLSKGVYLVRVEGVTKPIKLVVD